MKGGATCEKLAYSPASAYEKGMIRFKRWRNRAGFLRVVDGMFLQPVRISGLVNLPCCPVCNARCQVAILPRQTGGKTNYTAKNTESEHSGSRFVVASIAA